MVENKAWLEKRAVEWLLSENRLHINNKEHDARLLSWCKQTQTAIVLVNNKPSRWTRTHHSFSESKWYSHTTYQTHTINHRPPNTTNTHSRSPEKTLALKSPLSGTVTTLLVHAGEIAPKGTPLIIIEAMKMENEIRAPHDVSIKNIFVQDGDMVQSGQVLIQFDEGDNNGSTHTPNE